MYVMCGRKLGWQTSLVFVIIKIIIISPSGVDCVCTPYCVLLMMSIGMRYIEAFPRIPVLTALLSVLPHAYNTVLGDRSMHW